MHIGNIMSFTYAISLAVFLVWILTSGDTPDGFVYSLRESFKTRGKFLWNYHGRMTVKDINPPWDYFFYRFGQAINCFYCSAVWIAVFCAWLFGVPLQAYPMIIVFTWLVVSRV